MKPIIPLACLVGGIAIGWFVRPLASPAQPASSAPVAAATLSVPATGSSTPASADTPSTHSSGRPVKTETDADKEKAEAKIKDEVKRQQDRINKRITDFQRKKFEARLMKLAEELHLSPEQQEKIRASMEERFSKMGELFEFRLDPSEEKSRRTNDLGEMMKTDGLDEATAGILSDTQQEQYAGFKGKERQNRIESRAFKDLGNVTNVIDLTPDQRDAVYQVLSDQATERENRSSNTVMMNAFTEGMGMQIDDELGVQDIMQEQANSQMADKQLSQADSLKAMHESIKRRAETKAESLRLHLTETQFQQYRSHLQTKAASMISMFGGEGDYSEPEQ